jgi:hypothetical protein
MLILIIPSYNTPGTHIHRLFTSVHSSYNTYWQQWHCHINHQISFYVCLWILINAVLVQLISDTFFCNNTIGGYICSCPNGYVLESNNFTCTKREVE